MAAFGSHNCTVSCPTTCGVECAVYTIAGRQVVVVSGMEHVNEGVIEVEELRPYIRGFPATSLSRLPKDMPRYPASVRAPEIVRASLTSQRSGMRWREYQCRR